MPSFNPSVFGRVPTEEDLHSPGSAYLLVWGRHQTAKELDQLTEMLDSDFFLCGHQPQEMGHEVLHDRLEKLIAARLDSNRIGEMHFYLGLTLRGLKKNKAADAVWQKHYDDYPADRFAMLSRFHHTSYQFSPYGGGRGSSVMGSGQKRMTSKQVEEYLERLKPRRDR